MTQKNKSNELEKILVIEDQLYTLNSLNYMIQVGIFNQKDYPFKLGGDPEKELNEVGVDVARCYNDAKEKLQENDYEIVFLDNRMPYENFSYLEFTKDENKFFDKIENIGYGLIPLIRKNTNCKIIGTSSVKNKSNYDIDFYLDKTRDGPELLNEIYDSIKSTRFHENNLVPSQNLDERRYELK